MTKTPNSDHDSELPLNQTVSFIGELASSASGWQQKSIRIKATILAIAIGTIPSVALGSIAYYFVNRSIVQETHATKQETATKIHDKEIVLQPQKQLRQVFILGTAIVAVGVGAISFVLADRLLRKIIDAANAVEEIGRVNLYTRIQIIGVDDPFGAEFDAAMIWGPVMGRNVYGGLRYSIGKKRNSQETEGITE